MASQLTLPKAPMCTTLALSSKRPSSWYCWPISPRYVMITLLAHWWHLGWHWPRLPCSPHLHCLARDLCLDTVCQSAQGMSWLHCLHSHGILTDITQGSHVHHMCIVRQETFVLTMSANQSKVHHGCIACAWWHLSWLCPRLPCPPHLHCLARDLCLPISPRYVMITLLTRWLHLSWYCLPIGCTMLWLVPCYYWKITSQYDMVKPQSYSNLY